MSAKLSLSGSKSSSSSSLSSFRDNSSFQALRRAVSEHSPCTTASTFSNTITTITTTITTPPSTIASSSKSQTSPHASPQLDATILSSSASSPATTPAITSCSSSRPTITAATTTSLLARPSLLLPPPPEDVIKLLLSTTTYIYDCLTRLIDTNNTLRRSNLRIPGDQPICRADVLRGAPHSSRIATAVEGSSSASCPNGITHDALHIVNSHRAFARAIKAEIARLSAALAHFSPLSQSLRLRSFFSSLPASIGGSGLKMKVNKKHKCTGGEEFTAWSDVKKIIYMYDWLWTYSYSASVENWQEIIWACAVVTGVYGAGGLEGVNARMRDYGIAHAGVVDGFYMADWAVEQGAERRQAQMERLGNRQDATIPGEVREVVIRRRIAKVDGKWVQVDPRVIVTEKKDEVVNRSQEEVGYAERRWKVKLQVPWSVVAIGLKIKVLRESIKGKDKCKKECKGKVQETIEEDLRDEEYEKAMWR